MICSETADQPQQAVTPELLSPIIGIENRTAQEAFDIMADRIRSHFDRLESAPAPAGDSKEVARIVRWIDQAAERAKNHGSTEGVWLFRSQWLLVRSLLTTAPQPPVVDDKDAEIARLRSLLIDPGDPAWEDARGVLVAELRKAEMPNHARAVEEGDGAYIPSWMVLNLIGHARLSMREALERIANNDCLSWADARHTARAALKEPRDDR